MVDVPSYLLCVVNVTARWSGIFFVCLCLLYLIARARFTRVRFFCLDFVSVFG